MKLRLRSQKSKETIRVEVSDQCTLEKLKQTLLQKLASSFPADSIHLSLNRKHELKGSSPADSLQSLGITSGDLVFFTLGPSKLESKQMKKFPSTDFKIEKRRFVETYCNRSIFLRRVMNEGLDRNARKLLLITAHSVLSESGFVRIDRIKEPQDWRSTSFSMSLQYALPKLRTMKEVVLLKFHSLVHFVIVYGSVSCIRGSNIYRASLDTRRFPPNLDLINDENEGKKNTETKMLEFWQAMKDSLALPLLIDLEKAGLPRPFSFMLLPDDLKLLILQFLPCAELVRIQGACTELRNLASNDYLWKMKFIKEFPLGEDSDPGNGLWKPKFVAYYSNKMMRSIIDRKIGYKRFYVSEIWPGSWARQPLSLD